MSFKGDPEERLINALFLLARNNLGSPKQLKERAQVLL